MGFAKFVKSIPWWVPALLLAVAMVIGFCFFIKYLQKEGSEDNSSSTNDSDLRTDPTVTEQHIRVSNVATSGTEGIDMTGFPTDAIDMNDGVEESKGFDSIESEPVLTDPRALRKSKYRPRRRM